MCWDWTFWGAKIKACSSWGWQPKSCEHIRWTHRVPVCNMYFHVWYYKIVYLLGIATCYEPLRTLQNSSWSYPRRFQLPNERNSFIHELLSNGLGNGKGNVGKIWGKVSENYSTNRIPVLLFASLHIRVVVCLLCLLVSLQYWDLRLQLGQRFKDLSWPFKRKAYLVHMRSFT